MFPNDRRVQIFVISFCAISANVGLFPGDILKILFAFFTERFVCDT